MGGGREVAKAQIDAWFDAALPDTDPSTYPNNLPSCVNRLQGQQDRCDSKVDELRADSDRVKELTMHEQEVAAFYRVAVSAQITIIDKCIMVERHVKDEFEATGLHLTPENIVPQRLQTLASSESRQRGSKEMADMLQSVRSSIHRREEEPKVRELRSMDARLCELRDELKSTQQAQLTNEQPQPLMAKEEALAQLRTQLSETQGQRDKLATEYVDVCTARQSQLVRDIATNTSTFVDSRVKDNKQFFKEVHGYTPIPNTKTGLAGVRKSVCPTFRDKVLLPALRIYRARSARRSTRSQKVFIR